MNKQSTYNSNAIIMAFIISALLIFFCFSNSYGGDKFKEEKYRGIRVIAVPIRSDVNFDVNIMDSDNALLKLKHAIDLIYRKSLINAQAIDVLKKKGDVSLSYNPNFPQKKQDIGSKLHLAFFLPYYFDHPADGEKLPLPIVISRHGIKWPLPELAAIIIHELVGHGTQYIKGMTDTVRSRELECNAWLLQELANQDFGLDKYDKKMIWFRQQLGGVGGRDGHCSDFLRWVRKTSPEKIALYEQLNPDVPALLELLDQYIAHMDASGRTKKALQAREAYMENKLARISEFGTPEDQFGKGLNLLEGAIFKQDPKRGAMFIKKAAQKNLLKAQYLLASLYWNGKGLDQDRSQAYFWYCVAAGKAEGAYKKKILGKKSKFIKGLSPKKRNEIARRAKNWQPED
jgi:hypothetical protein